MLYFHVWLQNKGKFLVWIKYYIQYGIYLPSHVTLLRPRQNDLSNAERYLEPCLTFKMECFAKIVNG